MQWYFVLSFNRRSVLVAAYGSEETFLIVPVRHCWRQRVFWTPVLLARRRRLPRFQTVFYCTVSLVPSTAYIYQLGHCTRSIFVVYKATPPHTDLSTACHWELFAENLYFQAERFAIGFRNKFVDVDNNTKRKCFCFSGSLQKSSGFMRTSRNYIIDQLRFFFILCAFWQYNTVVWIKEITQNRRRPLLLYDTLLCRWIEHTV